MVHALSESYFHSERENWALRKLLHNMGLSDARIRRRVAECLKNEDTRQSALELMHQLCEETMKRLPEFDVEDRFTELLMKGPPQ